MTRPYLPSNGTEGCMFESEWCDRCVRDVPPDPEGGRDLGECQIHNHALMGVQPPEWVEDDSGPRCTAFQSIDTLKTDPLTRQPGDPDMPGQQTLFPKESA